MNLNDRTMWLLNHYGIKLTEEEYIGIKLTDGLYDENNKEYYITYNKDNVIKTQLPFIKRISLIYVPLTSKEIEL